jgi:hypothetical protein
MADEGSSGPRRPRFDWGAEPNLSCNPHSESLQHVETPYVANHGLYGIRVHGTGLPACTDSSSGSFLPNFYPKRWRDGVEMLYLLVTAANCRSRPGCGSSLPSWSCGFDSRRPLFTSLVNSVRPLRARPVRLPPWPRAINGTPGNEVNCHSIIRGRRKIRQIQVRVPRPG